MKLYYVPRTRAGRPRWLLEELEVPYEVVRLDPARGETHTPEHLALHPLGHVPVLLDGEAVIWESAAICAYLADKHPSAKLAPAPGTAARGQYYQWIFYAVTELEPALVHLLAESRRPEEQRRAGDLEDARTKFIKVAAALEAVLADGRSYLVEDSFSAADVVVGATAIWAAFSRVLPDHPHIAAYVQRLAERPAYKRARAD